MAYTDPAQLLTDLQFDPADFQQDIKARQLFPMRVPRPFVDRMRPGDRNDPLFRQVFTQAEEFETLPGYNTDPLEEQGNNIPGLLHKYQSRVLMILRGGCAINCRYCFRRHFPYSENSVSKEGWQQALGYIAADEKINEVIYSGGDPLMAKDDFLAWMTDQVAAIPHVTRLRIHTRLPVVIPQRITEELVGILTNSRLTPIMVLHINHANEIDENLKAALKRLKDAGITLLNQAVLLKGVNDSGDEQVNLSETLFAAGVMPYYLHLLDKVQGAAHFDLDTSKAREIMQDMIKRLPGYLVPKLVREIGGQPGKTPLDLQLHP